ncbi:MAG: hypothetical protein ACOYJF_02920 [Prevotella sp.]|jgi:hypothetical protein
MLQRDYFLRVIEEFAKALNTFLEKKEDVQEQDLELQDLYRQYVGPYDTVRNLSFEETLQYAKDQWKPEERIERLNMLAELLYAEGSYKGLALRSLLFEKAYRLFQFVEANGGEYSVNRQQKMQQIKAELQLKDAKE